MRPKAYLLIIYGYKEMERGRKLVISHYELYETFEKAVQWCRECAKASVQSNGGRTPYGVYEKVSPKIRPAIQVEDKVYPAEKCKCEWTVEINGDRWEIVELEVH